MQPARQRREQQREGERERLRFRLKLGENDQVGLPTLRFLVNLLERVEALEQAQARPNDA